MFIAKLLVPFLKRLWYDAVLVWGLNPGRPALETSTLPLGYRGGGEKTDDNETEWYRINLSVFYSDKTT
mgnify:CR=1 FL=1